MESITIGASPIGLKIKKNPLKIMIGGSGGAPAPPTPSDTFPSITDDFHRVEENMLTGTVTDEWEFAADSSEDFIPVPTPPPDLMPVVTDVKGGMRNGD